MISFNDSMAHLNFRAEVAWDIDTIYLAHDIRMLHLKDFDHLEQRFVEPYITLTIT